MGAFFLNKNAKSYVPRLSDVYFICIDALSVIRDILGICRVIDLQTQSIALESMATNTTKNRYNKTLYKPDEN